MGLSIKLVRRPSWFSPARTPDGPTTRALLALAPTMARRVLWAPNPGPQRAFLACPADWALYGGQVGGGKTDALLADFLGQAHLAGYTGLFIRKSYPELLQVIRRSQAIYPALGGKYRITEKTWVFPSGASLRFGYVTSYEDALRYASDEYQWIAVDECTHVPWDAIELLTTRMRAKEELGLRCYLRLSANPNGKHMLDIRARFIEERDPWEVYEDAETGIASVFIPSTLADTPQLAETGYGKRLLVLGEAERKALAEGDWYAYEGSVFTLLPGVHTWTWAQFLERTGQQRPPTEWRRYRSYDHGLAAPGACYWYAVDQRGRAFVYRELYTVAVDGKGKVRPNVGLGLEPRAVARMIATRSEGEDYTASWSGRDLFDEVRADHAGGVRLVSHFTAEGVSFGSAWTTGPGSRVAGKAALHERLACRDAHGRVNRMPMLVFITEECPHAIRTLPALEYAKHDPEQVDDTGEDHAFDSLAGWCKMNPLPAARPQPLDPDWMRARHTGAEKSRVG